LNPEPNPQALDPTTEYESMAWELLRCCLTRTLYSYVGRPAEDGGSELRPDLATELPSVSGDGLTWTMRLKSGLMWGPPLDSMEITTADVVRALERTALLGSLAYSFHYLAIEGFESFAAGESDSIAGLETPDDHTLVVSLVRPQGDLAHRFALPATAPLAPLPDDPSAQFGAATGHDDGYGSHLVSSGPYMLEGSPELDLSSPPEDQLPAPGLRAGESIVLVRNPSWTRATDGLRPALADRIELEVGGTPAEAHARIDDGSADLFFWAGPAPQAPVGTIEAYQDDPGLGRLDIRPRDNLWAITMNLGVPPLDDLHVRRAVNLALDKASYIELWGGPIVGQVATHIAPDSLEDSVLSGYDPFSTPGSGGSLDLAKAEMAQSKYDNDGDGVCDAPECRVDGVIELLVPSQGGEARPPIGQLVADDLAGIGLEVRPRALDIPVFFGRVADPGARVPMAISAGWIKDFMSAASFFVPLFRSTTIGDTNYSLVGATPEQLREWGYQVSEVPSVDDRIDECLALVGATQTSCWAGLDQYLMEEVVPYVPILVENLVQVVPKRVDAYSFSQFTELPALDRTTVSGS
jgi:peptide/nickel transport system substrate-binding protein